MCGIVGKINFDSTEAVHCEQIERMAASVRHRGPDDNGVWVSGNVGLGHQRLSIIDLSRSGRNPMCNEDQTIWIVFNGEVYNFQQLRPSLEARGHQFKSRTDTEVVLHAYEEYGVECVRHFRGMFAFAIWDGRLRRLLLARDRLGVKPLFHTVTASGILFGSEIKAILAAGEVDGQPDPIAIHQFLMLQCIPSPRTAFEEIKKLPPASILVWQPGSAPRIEKYWTPDYSRPSHGNKHEVVRQARNIVQEATEIRLIADVPVGLFLSGGIDSACVLAAARKAISGKIQTFSVAFGHRDFDESRYARLLAKHFETDHHELEVTPDAVQALPQIAGLFDEPFADSSAIPTYYLCKYTSQHVKVALSGDGGDEAFGGYQRYLALKSLRALSRIPGSRFFSAVAPFVPQRTLGRSRQRYLHELLALVDRGPKEQYRAIFLAMMDEPRWAGLYNDSFRASINGADLGTFMLGWELPSVPDDLTRAMASDTLSYIPDDLNVKVDICSMAVSLEVRSPFLDHQVVEFCATIPSNLKIRGTKQKYILKEAFKDELPVEILKRGKMGFGVPIREWMRNELRDFVRDSLLSSHSRIGDFFQRDEIARILDEHIQGKRNWHTQLWYLLILENWLQAQLQRTAACVA
jgi:asparagine synthase (glutamine-hydrolysing)